MNLKSENSAKDVDVIGVIHTSIATDAPDEAAAIVEVAGTTAADVALEAEAKTQSNDHLNSTGHET